MTLRRRGSLWVPGDFRARYVGRRSSPRWGGGFSVPPVVVPVGGGRLPPVPGPGDLFIAPAGTSGGSGSISSPWDLQTAFNQPGALVAGKTVWLRGGTYGSNTEFLCFVGGTQASPITLRQYPGERARI